MKTVTSEGITTMNKQTRRDAHLKLTSRFIVLLISILMVMSSTIAVFAATLSGETKDYVSGDASKGNAMAGTEYNTFAAGLDLQEVFLKRNAF